MKVPYLSLKAANAEYKDEILEAVSKVIDHGQIILGPEVIEFETTMAELCKTSHAAAVGSGSSAVFLSLKALEIGHGDEVIVPALSWIASANAIKETGATPVFADVRDDLNICPKSVESLISKNTKAILPVHFMGKVCDMDSLKELAKKHSLYIIEDSAQSFGASYKGEPAGSFGVMNCFSLNPMKVLAAVGDAGCITTNSEELAEKVRTLRYCGMVGKVESHYVSLNHKIDTIQAAILNVKLKKVSNVILRRREIAAVYNRELQGVVQSPCMINSEEDVFYGYTLLVDNREKFISFMTDNGIETKIQHSPLMPEQKIYKAEKEISNYPNAKILVEKIINIPNSEVMTDEQVHYVIEKVKEFFNEHS